jgi:hypothetical protein
MAKGADVKGTWVEDIIAQLYVEFRPALEKKKIRHKDFHLKVLDRVRAVIRAKLEDKDHPPTDSERKKFNEQLNLKWPGLSEVEHLMTEYRRKYQKNIQIGTEMVIDDPWSMATLDTYPIPPEALPAVLEAWKLSVEKNLNFTIRDAKWVSRLSATVFRNHIELLSEMAGLYALNELIASLTGYPFNSRVIDRQLMGLPLHWYDKLLLDMKATSKLE